MIPVAYTMVSADDEPCGFAAVCSRFLNLPTGGKERKHWALRPQKPLRLIRDGEVGGSGILYLTPTRYAVTTRMILH